MRKPSQSEMPIQSRDREENQTGKPARKVAERPAWPTNSISNHIIPHVLAMCVIMATGQTAHALTFTLNTGYGTGSGTLTLEDTGHTDPTGGLEEYVVTGITGTFDSQTITGIDWNYGNPDNTIETATNGNILVDTLGISFDTGSTSSYLIQDDTGGFLTDLGAADVIYGPSGKSSVTSFTASAPTTPVPFQAPLADAIPVIGSVLVLGALRKVRTFKNA